SNHGEDVKEYYFYLDNTPTHSYMKYLYKYPQAAFPYFNLVATSRQRNRYELEYELLDTGIFSEDRYFDVFVEYAKVSAEDILIQISVANRGPEAAPLHILPTLWFRNLWTWWEDTPRPSLKQLAIKDGFRCVAASHDQLRNRYLYCEGDVPLVVTENETNNQRLSGMASAARYVKDGINNYVVDGKLDDVNPERTGTKVSADYQLSVPAGETASIRLRLCDLGPHAVGDPFKTVSTVMQARRLEAKRCFSKITHPP